MLSNVFEKISFLYERLPSIIRKLISYLLGLALPLVLFVLNFNSGIGILDSIIATILFILSFYAIVIFIFLVFAFLWWIYDEFFSIKNKLQSFNGSELLTPSKIAKTIFSYTNVAKLVQTTIQFVIGWSVILLFWTFVLGICLNYISSTFIRIF